MSDTIQKLDAGMNKNRTDLYAALMYSEVEDILETINEIIDNIEALQDLLLEVRDV